MSLTEEKKKADSKLPYMPPDKFNPSQVLNMISKNVNQELNNSSLDDEHDICENDDTMSGVISELLLVLKGMRMEKYYNMFKEQDITLDIFLHVDDSDLQEIGVTDPKDREILLNSIRIGSSDKKLVVSENQLDDFKIALNICNEVILLNNYCAYLESQMRKNKLTDYKISCSKTACTYLREFTKTALTQATLISKRLLNKNDPHQLIDKTLKASKINLPKEMEAVLHNKNKRKGMAFFGKMMTLGLIIFLCGKYLRNLYFSLH